MSGHARDAGDLALPEGVRLIHIGPQKTGTTAIQSALHGHREELARWGVHYAGPSTRPRKAGWAIGLPGKITLGPRPPISTWERLAREMAQARSRAVVVSNEDFGGADDEQAARIVRDLGGDEPHVVMVARRLDRILPSQWQQRVRFGESLSYDDWLRDVLGDDPSGAPYRGFWRSHDLDGMVRRWTSLVGAERVTLVVGDDSDRDLLPRVFEQMLGLEPGYLVRAVQDSQAARPLAANEALGWSETELVRRLNEAAARLGWSKEHRRDVVRLGVVHAIKVLPPSDPARLKPALPPWSVDRVRELSRRRAECVRAVEGLRVVGDPARLLLPDEVAAAAEEAPTTISLDTAVAAVLGAVGKLDERAAEIAEQGAGDVGSVTEPTGRTGLRDRLKGLRG